MGRMAIKAALEAVVRMRRIAVKAALEAVVLRCSVKKVFLEISESTCARDSFLIRLQA